MDRKPKTDWWVKSTPTHTRPCEISDYRVLCRNCYKGSSHGIHTNGQVRCMYTPARCVIVTCREWATETDKAHGVTLMCAKHFYATRTLRRNSGKR